MYSHHHLSVILPLLAHLCTFERDERLSEGNIIINSKSVKVNTLINKISTVKHSLVFIHINTNVYVIIYIMLIFMVAVKKKILFNF